MIQPILRNAGVNPRKLLKAIRGWKHYVKDRAEFQKLTTTAEFPWGIELPMLTERENSAGELGAYFYQDQLVARWVHDADSIRHVDVGSRIDGFIGSISVFREVDVIDIRPEPAPVHNVTFHQLDLMGELPAIWATCTDSLSCLHTIEHFGLGRYGDPIDPGGYLKGIGQLMKMVKPGGVLYLSTQIGPQRIEFNAHRVFSPDTMLSWFAEGWRIERSAVIDDDRQVKESPDTAILKQFRGNLGVGIVAARKAV